MTHRVFVSAGEASGDRHLGALLDALGSEHDLELFGLGGDRVRSHGTELLAHVDELSVLGFSEVLKRLGFFRSLLKRCVSEIEQRRPDLILLADYPGFNLRLARAVKHLGIPVVLYVAPQVWAWRKDRRPGIAQVIDHLMVIFPFEEALFQGFPMKVSFVGHPLLDHAAETQPGFREALQIPREQKVLALLPGSRPSEVRALLPMLLEGTQVLAREGVVRVVSRAPGAPEECFEGINAHVWEGNLASLVAHADAAMVASGTATLETGLHGTPLAVVYKVGLLNWLLARLLVKKQPIGLVNIAGQSDLIPELIQGDLTAENIDRVARNLLFDQTTREEQRAYLSNLSQKLGGEGAAANAAKVVASYLTKSGGA
ncbi:MAG: lipid-A-disaccharide synthase [Candidatus Eisenbacteria bacterium]|uniref:Lipid-A-disaccharide synthase n=1 Tax=Eiseniibacteriota bacterium TaxID=2212470 RepID=A0A7Y2H3J1_UNCEI|nr:lipid-A-disaccharide synthase [Candidatus Eisenbacteria bacterium]